MRNALVRALSRIGTHLERQRRRGRTATTDALAGYAIEDGEAEGLITELTDVFGSEKTVDLPLNAAGVEQASDLPLARAVVAFELTPQELDAVVLAIAVELDSRFARLVAYINDHVGRTRPTLGLAYSIEDSGPVSLSLLERPFLRDGLVELEGDGPLSTLTVKMSRVVLARFANDHADTPITIPGIRITPPNVDRLEQLVLPTSTLEDLRAWTRSSHVPLVISGPSGVGRATCARAALGAVGVTAVEVQIEDALDVGARVLAGRREVRWHRGGLIVRLPVEWPAAATALLWTALAGVTAPLVVIAPTRAVEAIAEGAHVEPQIATITAPDLVERTRLWRAMLPDDTLSGSELDELAARFEFIPRTIARTIRRASVTGITKATLHGAAREVGASVISAIAQRLPLVYSRDDLVLPAKIIAELDLAVAWLRHKRHVYDTWGFGRRIALGRGLTALFAGPPGTGKTMTAQVLARDLGLDLYRVDLSRVMSKYIGETEKNLSRLFDEAQASGGVLFFDEADALFGKRSEVRDAHDRYANVEIGYLLQRMEEHEGAAILATNRVGDLDEAFLRRFHFLLDFPMPDASYLLRLWQGMLPAQTERESNLDLRPLAAAYELSGGEIRNCVLAAAYMAAAEGKPVGISHLERGLHRELSKTGRIILAPRRLVVEEAV